MTFKHTDRFGVKNNIATIENRFAHTVGIRMSVVQIRIGAQIYNLVTPVSLLPRLQSKGQCMFVEERKAGMNDYIPAQLRGRQLPGEYVQETRPRLYEVVSNINRHCNYPILMIDNY